MAHTRTQLTFIGETSSGFTNNIALVRAILSMLSTREIVDVFVSLLNGTAGPNVMLTDRSIHTAALSHECV